MPKPKSSPFALGQVVITPGALVALASSGQTPEALLTRHAQGDWGNLGEEDRRENDRSLVRGLRLLSAYALPDGAKLWIFRSKTSWP